MTPSRFIEFKSGKFLNPEHIETIDETGSPSHIYLRFIDGNLVAIPREDYAAIRPQLFAKPSTPRASRRRTSRRKPKPKS